MLTKLFIINLCLIVIATIICKILESPFHYPYFIHKFDVSKKRNPNIEDYLDMYLISEDLAEIDAHMDRIEKWKLDCEQRIKRSILKKYRQKQYNKSIDDKSAFKFYFTRSQTRYKQRNYVKSSYKVQVDDEYFTCDYDYIIDRYDQLADIDFECPLRAYHSNNQRKLATRKLREEIMKRDNYTCQICGKYMPDEVGLQIDHIIPVSKGGKTVPSNLRVLCSKCNGSKSNKIFS